MQPAQNPVAAGWYRSSHSAANNECVEISDTATGVGIRDSKAPGARQFTVGANAFTLFVMGLKGDPLKD
ncbi:DUF397 domain-containing protein [Streptomyces mutabilis]|uniref:DUF397 domain-containing protein n=1 Tax=Streptomyces mutabilis TaxID=67332 RepID=UPI00177EF3B3|nr:DUF397 domain-containing protein [Streptomyces mutabilis]